MDWWWLEPLTLSTFAAMLICFMIAYLVDTFNSNAACVIAIIGLGVFIASIVLWIIGGIIALFMWIWAPYL